MSVVFGFQHCKFKWWANCSPIIKDQRIQKCFTGIIKIKFYLQRATIYPSISGSYITEIPRLNGLWVSKLFSFIQKWNRELSDCHLSRARIRQSNTKSNRFYCWANSSSDFNDIDAWQYYIFVVKRFEIEISSSRVKKTCWFSVIYCTEVKGWYGTWNGCTRVSDKAVPRWVLRKRVHCELCGWRVTCVEILCRISLYCRSKSDVIETRIYQINLKVKLKTWVK